MGRHLLMDHAVDINDELDINKFRQTLPDQPGVYFFKDHSGRVIYVGKAKNLKKRVLSYFKPVKGLPEKTAFMMKRASGLDFIITSSEKDAFILESNLIKKHLPRYNIILRDDKQYPCLRLNIKETYPRLSIVRRIKKDGALYFGPFSSVSSVRSTLRVIDGNFQLRKCRGSGLTNRTRPCLNYQMGRCLGPCTHNVPESDYREIVQQVRLFLEGRSRELIDSLKKEMAGAADNLEFEKAAAIRDQIRAIEKTVERQHVVSHKMEDQDIIGLAQSGDLYQAVILYVRKGCVVESRNYLIKKKDVSAPEVAEAFLKQYYSRETFIPEQVLISEQIEDLLPITDWLTDMAGKRVVIHTPMRGEKLSLIKMALSNAENLLAGKTDSQKKDLMKILSSVLNLNSVPRFIEGLDISNLQGELAVGTVVSFVDGLPHKQGYRNYRIKEVGGIDDYGMMAELIKRRVSRGHLPDLFLVDGGKGHLTAVKRALREQGYPDIPEVVSIAKPDENRHEKYDKIYCHGRKNPVTLRPDHPVLLLSMQIRDEAHRRAITYHRKLRGKKLTRSQLSLIPGIGDERVKLLLRHFKDITSISMADMDDLLEVPGINRAIARNILSFFDDNHDTPKGMVVPL